MPKCCSISSTHSERPLYTWNLGDQFPRIVDSPAFMAIVLADNEAKNITIKIPFQLLNLTLSPPIVGISIQYSPCMPSAAYSPYMLSRAFLQAAFLRFEYEHNLSFIAQASGPNMEQSVGSQGIILKVLSARYNECSTCASAKITLASLGVPTPN